MRTIIKLLWLVLLFSFHWELFDSLVSRSNPIKDFQLNDFTLTTLDGQEITLSKLTETSLLTFSDNLFHCQVESASLNKVFNKYHESKELQI